jgi:hypothetical protein
VRNGLTCPSLSVVSDVSTARSKVNNFGEAKDLLAVVVGLLGTVLGYYFGKIPAEKSAEAARSEAATARSAAQSAEEARQAARNQVGAALALARQPPLPGVSGGSGGPHQLLSMLEGAHDRLSR